MCLEKNKLTQRKQNETKPALDIKRCLSLSLSIDLPKLSWARYAQDDHHPMEQVRPRDEQPKRINIQLVVGLQTLVEAPETNSLVRRLAKGSGWRFWRHK